MPITDVDAFACCPIAGTHWCFGTLGPDWVALALAREAVAAVPSPLVLYLKKPSSSWYFVNWESWLAFGR